MVSTTCRRGIFVAPFGELSEPALMAELAVEAEAAGWDGFFLWDHIVYREPVTHVADPWITLAAIASAHLAAGDRPARDTVAAATPASARA